MPSLLWNLVLLAPLVAGCSSKWSVVDGDGDGYSLADGDCWDAAEGPPGSGLSGADIYPGAVDLPYDGFDADCADNDDYDLDGDGFVTDAAHIGLETFAVIDTGKADAAGDCWDDPSSVPEGFDTINGFAALTAAEVNPDATDIPYDAVDSACDGGDEFDADGDGFASSAYPDRDGVAGDDCFDLDESGYGDFLADEINPDAAEFCGDEVDNDCDDLVDAEDKDAEAVTWYIDADSDEFGDIDANLEDKTAVVECDQPDGFVLDQTDCDDGEPTTYPDADEYCDGVDNDCNDTLDDDDAVDALDWYADSDSDGYGDPTVSTTTCYQPKDYVLLSTDCDDTSDRTYPGAAIADSTTDCMRDDDQDGYGDDNPPSGVTIGSDCDDGDNAIYPDAIEGVGDEVDQDCDTTEICYIDDDDDGFRLTTTLVSADIDCEGSGEALASDPTGECDDNSDTTYPGAAYEESTTSCRNDDDGDGYGDDTVSGSVVAGTDCDDGDNAINTAATELAGDEVDQDCDTTELCYVDADDDDYRLTSTVTSANIDCTQSGEAVSSDPTGECDDDSDTTYPGAAFNESSTSCRNDDDGDGYGDDTVSGSVVAGTDCDDDNDTINTSVSEIPGDEVDQDCDTTELCYVDADDDDYRLTSTVTSANIDCTDSGEALASDPTGECDDNSDTTYPGAAYEESTTSCRNDDDGDGYGDDTVSGSVVAGTDCDDGDSAINTAATELAGDEVDQDCDTTELCYVDADDDDYRLTSTVTSANIDCTQSGEAVSSDPTGECDDNSDTTYPGAAFNESSTSCRNDDDEDGYGDDTVSGSVVAGTDCDDDDDTINTAATELAGDEVDQDCDTTEVCYVDDDGDGYRLTSTVVSADIDCEGTGEALASDPTGDCDDASATTYPGVASSEPSSSSACMRDDDGDNYGDDTVSGSVVAGTDCDDSDSAINPGAVEGVGDEVDQNCDTTEECYIDADGDGYRLTTTTTSKDLSCTDSGEALATDLTGECDDTSAKTYPGAAFNESGTSCRNDDDGDGYGDDTVSGSVVAGTDCDDGDSAINSAAAEITGDEVDQDCDTTEICYIDGDDDGFRLTTTLVSADIDCEGSGEALAAEPTGDCDDTSGTAYPGAAFKESGTACREDFDGDGYGDTTAPGSGTAGTDCDDSEALKYPGADEVCYDGVEDNDCDGDALECELEDMDLSLADLTFEGVSANDRAGHTVRLGDLNGDGDIDALVGAWGGNSVYMFAGPLSAGTESLADADAILTGDTYAGYSISTLGDVDGDGNDDILIGDISATIAAQAGGAAYLLLGPVSADIDMTTAADAALYSTIGNAYAGYAVDVVGDRVNADTTVDLLIGAPNEKDGGDNPGAVYLHYGVGTYSADINLRTNSDIAVIWGESDGDDAGAAVAGIGDVDGDGVDDFAVGAPAASSAAGKGYFYYGTVTSDGTLADADVTMTGSSGSELGSSLASVGDLDGDGYDDFLVGAPSSGAGAAYLFFGPVTTSTPDATFTGGSAADAFGAALSAGGDINSDGDSDLIISALNSDTGGSATGSTYLFYGPFTASSYTTTDAAAEVSGAAAADQAGQSLAGGVDVDGDGRDDFMIGAHSADPGGASKAGEAYLMLRSVE